MTNPRSSRDRDRRKARPATEAMEPRQLLATVTGSLFRADAALTSPLPGRSAYVDLLNDGRLDPTDPSAISAADGSFAIAGVPAGSYVVRVATGPGESATTAAITLAADEDATVSPLALASGSPALPLTYATSRFGASVTNAVRAEVDALYGAILGRSPDAAGGAGAGAFIRAGGTAGGLAAILLGSGERRAASVTSYYEGLLGRAPSAGEVGDWVARLDAGRTEGEVVDAFLSSTEFNQLHPADADFVRAVYVDTLGRPASGGEVDTVTGLIGGGLGRAAVIDALLGSTEAAIRAATGTYTAILGRRPDAGGGSNAAGALRAGSITPVGLAVSLAGSAEFLAGARASASTPTTLAIPKRAGFVFDDRGILYVTDGAFLDRYDTRAGVSLPRWRLGGNLVGIDLSPDGKTLAVADGFRQGIDLVDTTTGVSTRVNFEPTFAEAGPFSVAWGADGKILVTTTLKGSGAVPLRRYDPATGTTTIIATISDYTALSASADRSVIALGGRVGSGAIDLYDVAAGKIVAHLETSYNPNTVASSADGSQFILPGYNGATVVDRVGNTLVQHTVLLVRDPRNAGTRVIPLGAAYSPTSHYLFTAESGSPGLAVSPGVNVYDTRDLTLVTSLDRINFNWSGTPTYDSGYSRVSPDGRTLAVSIDGGVKIYDVDAYA